MCTQIGVWDVARALKRCPQPSHNPAEKRREACVTAVTLARPYLLFPSPKGHASEGGCPAAQASEELPTARGTRRRVGRADTREAQQEPRGFEAPLLPAPSGAAPGAGPVGARQAVGWGACPFKKRVRARMLLSSLFRPGSGGSGAHARSQHATSRWAGAGEERRRSLALRAGCACACAEGGSPPSLRSLPRRRAGALREGDGLSLAHARRPPRPVPSVPRAVKKRRLQAGGILCPR